MYSLNRIELIGRLGRTPEMRYTGRPGCHQFSLATDRPAKAGTKPETDWHQITCWGKLGEFGNTYLTKGRLVFVAGRIAYRSWEGHDGVKRTATEIVASELILLDRKPDSRAPVAEKPVEGELDDDVPF